MSVKFNVSEKKLGPIAKQLKFFVSLFWKFLNFQNTEVEQVYVLREFSKLMKNIKLLEENRIVLAGDLNVFFDSNLEAKTKICSKTFRT